MSDSVKFPLECPQCRATAGMPYRAATTANKGVMVVSLRCLECGQQWEHGIPSSSYAVDGTLTSTGVAINAPPKE